MMPNSVHLRRPTVVGPIPMLLLLLLVTVRSSSAQPSSSSNNNGNNNPPYNGLTNFNPSMAIVIVVLISAFFFLGFFSIYIRQCGGAAIRGDAAAVAAGGRSRRGNAQRGLDPEILETFPTLVYSEVKGLKLGKDSLECAVCLSEFEDDETLKLLPKCSHAFHPDCIDAWLAAHVTCPVCRSNLVPDPSSPSDPALPTADAEAAEADPIVPPDHVAISVEQEEDGAPNRGDELADLARIGSERRAAAMRAKSVARPPRFPRSHSTGHSVLARPGENLDRFTLRLPEHVKREIVDSAAASRLQRTKSCVNFPSTEMSTRRGYRSGAAIGEGSSRAGRSVRLGRSDRWPSFLARTLSARFTSRGNGKRGDGEGSTKKGETDGSVKGRLPSVRVPFECLGGGVRPDGDYDSTESQTVPINRV